MAKRDIDECDVRVLHLRRRYSRVGSRNDLKMVSRTPKEKIFGSTRDFILFGPKDES